MTIYDANTIESFLLFNQINNATITDHAIHLTLKGGEVLEVSIIGGYLDIRITKFKIQKAI